MRTAVFSTALIFGGLLRRLGAVLFGIRTIREEAQRGLMYPRRYAIGGRPDLLISTMGPQSRYLLATGADFPGLGKVALQTWGRRGQGAGWPAWNVQAQ
jgi:hypothetical protein